MLFRYILLEISISHLEGLVTLDGDPDVVVVEDLLLVEEYDGRGGRLLGTEPVSGCEGPRAGGPRGPGGEAVGGPGEGGEEDPGEGAGVSGMLEYLMTVNGSVDVFQ